MPSLLLAAAGPAAALAAAQRSMLASRDEGLSHPYNWAAFALVGEAPLTKPATEISAVSVKDR